MFEIILGFLTAFFLTYFAIPSIINISRKKHLFDEPNERKSHSVGTPNLGGIAIFAGMLFSIILWTPFDYFVHLQYIICAFVVLFLIGAKDDIDPISPFKKLMGQLIAAVLLVFVADIRLTSFYGIFGVYELPYFIQIIFTIFVIISVINSFNLIDGVNGLAGGIGLIVSFSFGVWFFLVDHIELAIISATMIGALVAFLKYNITPAKIFMGDTGSMIIGCSISILAIRFIEINSNLQHSQYFVSSGPAIAIAIIIIPVFDTLRVMIIRIMKNKSPFIPDKNHLHHLLLGFGFSHMKTTAILSTFNVLLIILALSLRHLGSLNLGILIFIISMAFSFSLHYLSRRHQKTSK